MPAKAEIQCKISDTHLRTIIDDLSRQNDGSYSIPISSNLIKIEFMDKSDAEAFKKQCEEIGLTVSVTRL